MKDNFMKNKIHKHSLRYFFLSIIEFYDQKLVNLAEFNSAIQLYDTAVSFHGKGCKNFEDDIMKLKVICDIEWLGPFSFP